MRLCSTGSTGRSETPLAADSWRPCAGGEARITDLAAPLPMSFAAVARHVSVLEDAGLVARDVRGREHWLTVRTDSLADAERWIGEQTAFWSARADALADQLRRAQA